MLLPLQLRLWRRLLLLRVAKLVEMSIVWRSAAAGREIGICLAVMGQPVVLPLHP